MSKSIQEIRSGLITIAARLARGDMKASPFVEDHRWPKTTPKSAIRYSVSKFRQAREVDSRYAQAIKELADSLANDSKDGEPHGR